MGRKWAGHQSATVHLQQSLVQHQHRARLRSARLGQRIRSRPRRHALPAPRSRARGKRALRPVHVHSAAAAIRRSDREGLCRAAVRGSAALEAQRDLGRERELDPRLWQGHIGRGNGRGRAVEDAPRPRRRESSAAWRQRSAWGTGWGALQGWGVGQGFF